MDDRRTLRELSRDEALRLLAEAPMGRVVFTQRALPAIRPVNHAFVDGHLIIRTNLGSALASAAIDETDIAGGADGGTVVAYEADAIDAASRTGWSVVVTGLARLVLDPADKSRYEALLQPWIDNAADCVLRIHPDIVTGFRLVPAAEPAAGRLGAGTVAA